MNAPSKTKTQTFNLLSIGHRGVGKTVFLVGSYAEQKSNSVVRKSPTWFECQDTQVQHNLNTLLEYISQTGQYPPATMKITNFTFAVKTQNILGEQELCKFRWWDIPGEICNNDNANFQKMVMESHGGCVFIDTHTLYNNSAYSQTLQNVIKQVEAISSLAYQSGLTYIFAIVLTKCDLLTESPQKLLKIEENIRPLMARLDANKIQYRRFYSTIPIIKNGKMSVLQAKGASAPLLWLASELSHIHYRGQPQSLASGIDNILNNTAQPSARSQGVNREHSSSKDWKQLGLWGAIGFGLLVSVLGLLFGLGVLRLPGGPLTVAEQIQDYQETLDKNPNDPEALLLLSKLYSELTEFDKAVPLMEKLVDQQPENTTFLSDLAFLYAVSGNKAKEEEVYDKILKLEPKSILALTSKAKLRSESGDNEAAKTLFVRAEEAAPTKELKQEIRRMAGEAQAPSNP
ncbi:hypothetical protein [Acaryochloris sp. IP29b_bin.137]|uniref:tetratricopeptide repeat protein n=1 Tax=Acaryochloris sp. IP29b_bin.137 TaxID=2969217 RepID=UPI0026121E35|nr:hypothetical protein [Acaryochloris sp. IP29b_bin.137]